MNKLELPDQVINIIRKSLSLSTWKQYESSLKKYVKFCTEKGYDVWKIDISQYLNFLSSLVESGLSYNSINTARSALSTVFGMNSDINIGENKLICKFMKGVYKSKPPLCKYNVTWDPSSILELISQWDNSTINLERLSLKLVAILALTTAQRVQTLKSLKISNIIWSNPVQIKLTDVLKTTTIRNQNPLIILPPYHDVRICPVACLKIYIDKTKEIRLQNCDQLLISFVKPHGQVTSQTISRWLCTVLKLAGIDVKEFSAHSYRHAASSTAANRGVNVDVIMKSVGWSATSKTFATFYHKPIVTNNMLADAVLGCNS